MPAQIIKQTTASLIIALSNTEVGKVVLPNRVIFVSVPDGKPVDFLNNEQPTLEKEIDMLRYANAINNLLPKYIRLDTWQTEDGETRDMMVMERLYPLPIYQFERAVRVEMIAKFEAQLKELHDKFFVHADLMRPTNYFTRNNPEWIFANVIQTPTGLRMVDTGFSLVYNKQDSRLFIHTLIREQEEMEIFRNYYLADNAETK